ncbi:deoxynucleoside triphosphate triphosphohydrolase SAMHD1-like [Mercenaria mercenaria]|uniref:deoxynucleoside triphosphate triphosphohydrolase SAMHD1-like n=1 Tax=Mercenaria mercenaria TaxID=6596 RepID=UPI00234F7DEB|nr:deoxynucleoside triphosphate triphosphohydrolase SAMHD1-like [Mercenaria mercenaria]
MAESPHPKVFNDPIHGHIELHPLCVKIVDTPYFQRLRNIKQLGTCYLVYPGASHNRFEHSLGVCYLAGKLLRAIQERQSDLLSEKDILCVQIAGLCHDLGQGPFSHLFEKKFIPKFEEDWKYEDASVKMFEHMLKVNDESLRNDFKDLMDDFEDKDIDFITEMIRSPKIDRSLNWEIQFKGRGKEQAFLYEVVSNKNTGIDVDRWDYLARDSYMLGMKNIFDLDRCISVARVLEVEGGTTQICFRDKEAQDIFDMFYTNMTLHRRAYQHKTTNIISRMVCDALLEASDHLMFEGKNGAQFSLAETINDMEAFSKVTDDVFHTILQSNDSKLKNSKEILKNVVTRKLYKCVGQTQIKKDQGLPFAESSFKEALLKKITTKKVVSSGLAENYTKLDVVKLNLGMDDKDPIQNVRFYSKFKKDEPIPLDKDQVSYVLPDTFSEQIVRVYCNSSSDEEINIVKESFDQCCVDHGYPRPKDMRGELIHNGQ